MKFLFVFQISFNELQRLFCFDSGIKVDLVAVSVATVLKKQFPMGLGEFISKQDIFLSNGYPYTLKLYIICLHVSYR